MGLPFVERSLREADIATAEAALLTSTPFGVMPVRWLEGKELDVGQAVVERVRGMW
jgi:branched-subunit amino acid aminotransferase/4-amino-4-deoxychorismate lyase